MVYTEIPTSRMKPPVHIVEIPAQHLNLPQLKPFKRTNGRASMDSLLRILLLLFFHSVKSVI